MQKNPVAALISSVFLLLTASGLCPADTFSNINTGEILHGYANTKKEDGKTTVQTREKGTLQLNLADWEITPDRQGRNNKVIVLTLDRMIQYEIETAALEEALAEAADSGPLFILLELDTPGGRLDLAQRLVGKINNLGQCCVICFIKSGRNAGAISAGAAVALACDKIFMAKNTSIGGATMITFSARGGPTDLKEAFGDTVGEKFSSIWQANLASLAEQNGRPGLLARAMVDKEIEVVEVIDGDKRLFVDPVNKKQQHKLVKTWTKKGSLLTLTAAEAVGCTIADKIIDTRDELLRHLNASDAEIVTDDAVQKAGKTLSRAQLKLKKLRRKIDLDIKKLGQGQRRAQAISLVKRIRTSLRQLTTLARQYPDLDLDVEAIEDEYNSVEAFYQKHKRAPR